MEVLDLIEIYEYLVQKSGDLGVEFKEDNEESCQIVFTIYPKKDNFFCFKGYVTLMTGKS